MGLLDWTKALIPRTLGGSGDVVTERMALADFTVVEAHNGFDVEISQSDSFGVTVRVDDNVRQLVEVSKNGDTLRLRLKRGVSLRGATLEASITMPDLEGLTLSGTSKAKVTHFRASGSLDIALSGASTMNGDIEAGDVNIHSSGTSKAACVLLASNVGTKASGASGIVLDGSATGLAVDGSATSRFELAGFSVSAAKVRLSGASKATVNAHEGIDPVRVSGTSRLQYLGDAVARHVSKSGGSTVAKIGN